MQQLFENWRKYLNEAAQTLKSMPEGVSIQITKMSTGRNPYDIYLIKDGRRVGQCGLERFDRKDLVFDDEIEELEDYLKETGQTKKLLACIKKWWKQLENLYTLHVWVDDDMKGYGPLLIDLAMELAAKDGKWIIPPNTAGRSASDDFRKVMKYYFYNRPDVDKKPINKLCWYLFSGINVEDPPLDKENPEVFLHLYTKKPTTLNSQEAKRKIKFS